MRELILLLPRLVTLVGRLLTDPAVPVTAKVALGAVALYLANPVDLLPDFIPFVGYLDDALVVLLVVDGLLNHLDRDVLLKHWRGDPASLERAGTLARRFAAWVPARIKARVFGGRKAA